MKIAVSQKKLQELKWMIFRTGKYYYYNVLEKQEK